MSNLQFDSPSPGDVHSCGVLDLGDYIMYTTPVTDRAQSDITNRTSKAFLNTSDWTRIYENSKLVNSLAAVLLNTIIAFNQVLTVPTTTSFPTVTDYDTMLNNIEVLRLAVAAEAIAGTTTEIKDDYIAGASQETFNYTDVNLWESTLNVIWVHFSGASYSVCPTLSADLTVTTGNNQIYIDCLDAANLNIDLQGSANLYII